MFYQENLSWKAQTEISKDLNILNVVITNLMIWWPKLVQNLQTMDLSFFVHDNIF